MSSKAFNTIVLIGSLVLLCVMMLAVTLSHAPRQEDPPKAAPRLVPEPVECEVGFSDPFDL